MNIKDNINNSNENNNNKKITIKQNNKLLCLSLLQVCRVHIVSPPEYWPGHANLFLKYRDYSNGTRPGEHRLNTEY